MVKIMDSTLRDGANVVGKGFDAEITDMVLKGLVASHVDYIEFGNAGGAGAYEVAGFTKALKDEEYFKIAQKYLHKGSMIGVFLNPKRYREAYVERAAEGGMQFLRIGLDADEITPALDPLKKIKSLGLKAFYAAMKAYLVSPEDLAEKAKKLESLGLDEFTVMDSAGCMLPEDVARLIETLKKAVSIPIAFHGHNNLGLSVANAIAAYEHGADILDGGLMGMARSAGNMPAEACVALMQKRDELKYIDTFTLLKFIHEELEPAMKEKYDYHNPISAFDLVLGMTGLHSSTRKTFEMVARDLNVNVFALMAEVAKVDIKAPKEALMREIAEKLQ